MSNLLLLLKRLLVLLLGLALVWFSAFNLFPWIDDRLPLTLALLATYCFLAYIGLPALSRVWHALHKPTQVPTRSVEHDGWAADPINIVVLARSENDLKVAMQKAGWLIADPPTFRNVVRMVLSITFNRPYPNAPFEANYVFGRRQDLGFQIPTGNSPRKRHHVRFWQLGTAILDGEHEHTGFWRRLLERFLNKKKRVWIGAAVYDWGINAKKRNLQLSHGVDGNTVAERDFLVKTLEDAKMLKKVTPIKAGDPLRAKHHRFGELLITDGYVKLCVIKHQILPIRQSNHEQ
jgi:hypothetical protein